VNKRGENIIGKWREKMEKKTIDGGEMIMNLS